LVHFETVPLVESALLRLIPLFPLLGVVVCLIASLRNKPDLAKLVAPGAVGVSFVIALVSVLRLWSQPAGAAIVDTLYTWIHVDPLRVDLALRIDALSAVMVLIVTGVGFLIHVYSIGYMHGDPDVARFFAYLNLFMFSMLLLILGDSLPVLFVGWEGVGLCSYLLIGFWYTTPANVDAGRKAFVVNRIGDAGFLIGTFLLFWSMAAAGAPSLRFADVNRLAPALAQASPATVTAICLFLFVGATGKSAQIPLFVWLPDAMAGPTPVSALIHAATMVTAGVYMVARLSPLFALAPIALDVIALVGALTALFAATVALVQTDIKKVLAYSTVSQLGYMFLGLGSGAYAAAIFHVLTHAFFKALLFLGAGSVIHSLSGEQDVEKMGGLKHKLPITSKTFLVAALAISGVPGFSGFFSKDEILGAAFESGHVVLWLIGVLTAGMTAFYMFRLYFLTFEGESRVDDEKAHHAHESPPSMAIPLVVLAVLSVIGGWVGLPHGLLWGDRFGESLAPALAAVHEGHAAQGGASEWALMAFTSAFALGGIGVAYFMYLKSPGVPQFLAWRAGAVYTLLVGKYYVDELYDRVVVKPYVATCGFFWRVIDAMVIDGMVNGTGEFVAVNGGVWRRLQSGNVQHYALAMLLGALCTAGYYWIAR
jgi:NADH-quinone oxidoreductase subunit L